MASDYKTTNTKRNILGGSINSIQERTLFTGYTCKSKILIKAKTRARESLRPVTPILNCLFDALRTVLETFGYPNLAINMVKEQLKVKKKTDQKQQRKLSTKRKESRKMVVIPYDSYIRIFAKHRVATAVKPQTALRQILVQTRRTKLISKNRRRREENIIETM